MWLTTHRDGAAMKLAVDAASAVDGFYRSRFMPGFVGAFLHVRDQLEQCPHLSQEALSCAPCSHVPRITAAVPVAMLAECKVTQANVLPQATLTS